MAIAIKHQNSKFESLQRKQAQIPMHVVGGNSTLAEAKVVFLGTRNHYNPIFQRKISKTLSILPQPGDVVLSEGESFGGRLKSSWIPEMAGVDTGKITMRGWENAGLYKEATGIAQGLFQDINVLNILSGLNLGQMVRPFIESLTQRINTGMANFDKVVWHDRTRVMKASIMNVLGHSLQENGTIFSYAGAAHLTGSELGGMNGIKHVVLEV
jgi:hypothetical protein